MKPLYNRGGFTLIELLVAIAIIAILAALLLPIARQAHRRALEAECLVRQREIARATLAFTNDNNGLFPAFNANAQHVSAYGTTLWEWYWHVKDYAGSSLTDKGYVNKAGARDQVRSESWHLCPDESNSMPPPSGFETDGRFRPWLAYNSHFGNVMGDDVAAGVYFTVYVHELAAPSRTAMFGHQVWTNLSSGNLYRYNRFRKTVGQRRPGLRLPLRPRSVGIRRRTGRVAGRGRSGNIVIRRQRLQSQLFLLSQVTAARLRSVHGGGKSKNEGLVCESGGAFNALPALQTRPLYIAAKTQDAASKG